MTHLNDAPYIHNFLVGKFILYFIESSEELCDRLGVVLVLLGAPPLVGVGLQTAQLRPQAGAVLLRVAHA